MTQPVPNTSKGIVISVPKDDRKYGYIKCSDQEKHVRWDMSRN